VSRESGADGRRGDSAAVEGPAVTFDASSGREIRRLEGALAVAFSLALVVVSILLAAVGRHGRASPMMPEGRLIRVGSSSALLATLEATGMRGGTLVYLSRFLHSVPVTGVVPREALTMPVETFDLSKANALRVDPRNFLWLALEGGLAREIVHVLPAAEYREKRRALSAGDADIWFSGDRVVTHETGSRRTIAEHVPVERFDGPFLAAIDASYLDGETPGDPGAVLAAAGLERWALILNRAEDNPDVSDLGRRRLDAFAERWGRED
jgi:hypothetical protein